MLNNNHSKNYDLSETLEYNIPINEKSSEIHFDTSIQNWDKKNFIRLERTVNGNSKFLEEIEETLFSIRKNQEVFFDEIKKQKEAINDPESLEEGKEIIKKMRKMKKELEIKFSDLEEKMESFRNDLYEVFRVMNKKR